MSLHDLIRSSSYRVDATMANSNSLDQTDTVIVSYHTSPSPDVWERIHTDLRRQLPLKNLLWKSASRSVRTINQVHLDFQPLASSDLTTNTNAIPSISLANSSVRDIHGLSTPLLHMLFVACDVGYPFDVIRLLPPHKTN